MPALILECCAGRLARILAALVVLFVGAALALSAPHLILVTNGLALSAAAGVGTAYVPMAGSALRRRLPTRGDVLGAGIFLAGLAEFVFRLESIAARDLGRPHILNSAAAALPIFLAVAALAAFLWAPYAEDGNLPREKWGRAGLIVALGVATIFAAGVAHHGGGPTPLVRLQ